MKIKNIFRLKGLFMLSALLMFTIALALNAYAEDSLISCTADIPSVVNVGTELNASFNATTSGDFANFTHIFVAFEVRSASTANSSFSVIGNVTNTTAVNHTNMTIPDVGVLNLEPSDDYQVKATCYATRSETGDAAGDNVTVATTVTGVTFDLGDAPSIPTSISPTGKNTSSRTHNFRGTVNGANTTGCTLTFTSKNPGQKQYAMTHSGNTCTQAISNIAEGSFPYTITASDGTNTSVTAEQSFSIDLPSSASRKAKLFNFLGGGSKEDISRKNIGRGLAIAQDTRAGEVSNGLGKAMLQINEFTQRETQPKELAKTGIGIAGGAVTGAILAQTILPIPGTFIVGAIVGGTIGVIA